MLLDFPQSTRAPGRGRYVRGCSATERFRAQRERLLCATAIAYLEGAPSVARVSALSGVGRNTFYECFDDFEHALGTVRREERQRFRRTLGVLRVEARQEHDDDGVALLCRVWLELIAAEPVRALLALEPTRGEQGSMLLTVFREALASLRSAGWAEGEEARLFHAGVCAEASGRALALAMLGSSQAAPGVGEGGAAPLLGAAVPGLVGSVRCLLDT